MDADEADSFRRKLRVLVADGYPDTAWTLAAVLRLLGAEAVAARTGPEALRLAEEFRPDLVVMDLELPGLDGCEAARRLRRGGPAAPLLVAVTGHHDEDHRRQAREAGFDHYLLKPTDIDALRPLLSTTGGRWSPSGVSFPGLTPTALRVS